MRIAEPSHATEPAVGSILKSSTCLTAAAFYDLRRQVRSLGLTHSPIRPKTKLDVAIPLIGRRAYWQALSSRMELRFPRLGRPSWLALVNCMLVAINYTTLATRYSTRNPTDVWNALQLIVAEQLGVDRSAVVPHARFVQDLGAD